MLSTTLGALLALQVGVTVNVHIEPGDRSEGDSVRVEVDSATLASAYLDAGARELVRLARERRDGADRSILAYRTLARELISVGVSALRRERLLFRHESASRIHWRRDGPIDIQALGAREVIPFVSSEVNVPRALERSLPRLAFDPTNSMTSLAVSDSDFIRHPLAPGSEADYRFGSGDTTRIQLPEGHQVTLIELRLIPRRADPHLLSGSLWLETEGWAVVQSTFRLARAFDLERDGDEPDDVEDIPGMFLPIRADFRYLTIEYGLWEMKWWLPRLVAFEGYAQAGRLLRVPIRYERSYSEYHVVGDTLGLPPVRIALAGVDSKPRRRRSRRQCSGSVCRRVRVELPADTALLLTGEHLPHSIFEDGEQLLREDELRDILGRVGGLPAGPADLRAPRLLHPGDRLDLARYNRIEGLSLGARVEAGYGRFDAELTARLGLADLAPRAELALRHETATREVRTAAYRRLTPVTSHPDPLSLANSLDALTIGRDDGDYLDAYGIEVAGEPAGSGRPWYAWRLYAEAQRPLAVETDFSIRRLFDRDFAFRPNLPADRADQFGAALTLRVARGLDPRGFRWGAEADLGAETGTYRFARTAATLGASFPLTDRWHLSLESAAGITHGAAPIQAAWFLGGPATLRGYAPLSAIGDSFWRTRSELSTSAALARIGIFSDLGWAGPRESFGSGRPLLSAGAGASLLDGLIRLDIARALRGPTGWRVDLYIDSGF